MKKPFLITISLLVLLLILMQSGVVNAVVLFLLTGIVPSTNYSLQPSTMLGLAAIGTWLLLATTSQAWLRKRLTSS